MINTVHYIPEWLKPLLGNREKAILADPKSRVLCVDQDGERLDPSMRVFERPNGEYFVVCGKRKIICG